MDKSIKDQTLERLLGALTQKGDFPSLASTLSQVVQALKAEESDDQVAQTVLQDFSLTQRVLRLANSPMYASFGGSVTTVSKALYILGTETVAHLVVGLKLMDNLGQSANGEAAELELSKTLMAGAVARAVAGTLSPKDAEESAVAALLNNMGRMLVCFYLPDDFARIAQRTRRGASVDDASTEVLGLTFLELALHVARSWQMPDELRGLMGDESVLQRSEHLQWVRAVGQYSGQFVDEMVTGSPVIKLQALATAYSKRLGVPAGILNQVSDSAYETSPLADARLLLAKARDQQANQAAEPPVLLSRLSEGLREAAALAPRLTLPQITRLVSETYLAQMKASRVFFFLRKPAIKAYELAFAVGTENVSKWVKQVRFEEQFSPNVIHGALAGKTSVYLRDTADERVFSRMPAWLKVQLGLAKSTLVIPVIAEGRPVGLFMVDWLQGHVDTFSAAELESVNALKHLVESKFIRQPVAPGASLEAVC